MTNDQLTIFLVLGIALLLFAWGRWRYDLVALISLAIVVTTGLIPTSEVFTGFGHPAVITVAAVLVISQALKNAGVVDVLARGLIPFTRHPLLHIAALTITITITSAFMNNVGALALLLPVALATAAEHQRSPALLLMPLAFGSILGGMTTMIGTPPNIIIGLYRAELSGEAFSMFDFSPVGVAVALSGVIFVTLIGWRLIPKERLTHNPPQQLFEIDAYLAELKIGKDSSLIGQKLTEVDAFDNESIDLIGLARGHGQAIAVPRGYKLLAGDILVVQTDPSELQPLVDNYGLELLTTATKSFDTLTSDDLMLAEGVITPNSPLDGRDITYLRHRTGNTVALVAVARQGRPLRTRLRKKIFKAGDILLLQGEADTMDDTLNNLQLLPLAERGLQIKQTRRIGFALVVFGGAIALGASGLIPIAVAFLLAILIYTISGILPIRNLYNEIDWPVIVLLGAMIPVGRALESTGATTLVATSIVDLTQGLPVIAVLALVLIVTMFLSDIINNAATALVMAPIAVGIANNLGVNVDAFLMAVAVGASCAFLTPIGHQSNTLVMGPGGYHFGDYWRMGLPLEILIILIGVPMILYIWPLA